MSKKLFVLLCVLIGGSVLLACTNGSTSPTEGEPAIIATEEASPTETIAEDEEEATEAEVIERTIYIAPYTELCEDNEEQECLLVRESLADEWEAFSEPIAGFQYIAGFNYKLLVLEETPLDGSAPTYMLGEVLSQEGSFEAAEEEIGEPRISTQVWYLDYLITNTSPLQNDITLQFGEDQVTGSGGCNEYVAGFVNQGDNQLQVQSIGASRKLCDELISQQERDFFDALSMVATFEQGDASTLIFHDASGTPILTFVTSR